MADRHELIKQILAAAAKATPGPWGTDTMQNDGEFGDGPDPGSGFTSYAVVDEDGNAICDTLNSGLISVHVEYDEDGADAWDEQGSRNAAYIALANPSNLTALVTWALEMEARNAELEKRNATLEQAQEDRIEVVRRLVEKFGEDELFEDAVRAVNSALSDLPDIAQRAVDALQSIRVSAIAGKQS